MLITSRVLLGALVFGLALFSWNQHVQLQETQRELQYYQSTHLSKSGWSAGFGDYRLVSLDSGASWWNAEYSGNKVGITGPADPKLISQLEGMDALIAYVQEHGPIGSFPITQEELKMLEAAGLTP